ncbi:MAG: YfhO family protein [Oscillospiraceae bacterium]|nr:YfhO family protein [Oscillospiraceae bacterium]
MAWFRRANPAAAGQKSQFRRELGLYTLIYLVFFSAVFLPVILRDGLILGGDGYGIYYPGLVNFRRTLLDFGSNLRHGSFRLPMMNFNYGFGTDNLTLLPSYAAFPLFWLTVLIPVRLLPAFLTAVVFLLDYLSGIAFLRLCRHFGHQTYWNSLMALSYACATCFIDNYLYNPHFMYMLAAFPLMVIGIDRVIQKKGWRLLCFCVFWLCFTSFTMLVYTLPFLALFAFVRVMFVYREHFIQNLLKAFLRCLPVLITGALLSAVVQLPTLYLLANSARSMGNSNLNYVKLLIPSLSRMSECFFLIEPTAWREPLNINPVFIAMPGVLLTLLVLKQHRELRIHLLIIIACVSLPLIDYGLNGFQYSLIRWGCAPALALSFAGSVGMSEFTGLDHRQYRRTVGILCFYWITYSSSYFLKYEAGDFCAALITLGAICRLIPPLCRLWHRLTRAAWKKLCRFGAILKGKTPSVKRYLATAGAALGILAALLGIVALIFLPQYTFYPQLAVGAGLTLAASVIILKKKKWAAVCGRVLAVCFFASAAVLYTAYHDSSFEAISDDLMYQMIGEELDANGSFSRSLYVKLLADEAEESGEDEERENRMDIQLTPGGIPKMFATHDYTASMLTNYSLIHGLPDTAYFHNLTDEDLYGFLNRCGQDAFDHASITDIEGFRQEPVLYTLFGIGTVATRDHELAGFGMTERRTAQEDGKTVRLYHYDYAFPLGITYDSFMDGEHYASLKAAVLPYVLLQTAYAETPDGGSLPADSAPQPDTFRCEVQTEKEYLKTNSVGMNVYQYSLTLNEEVPDCFLYLETDGTSVRYPSGIDLKGFTAVTDGKESRRFLVINDLTQWQWIRHTDRYAFPLGYCTEPVHTIEFELPMECEELAVYAIPASVLTDAYAARCEETLQNVQLTDNRIDGDITVSKDKLLSVSVIHNDGWSVTVDGKEAPLCKVNGLFLGVQLSAGTHHVQFTYRTPRLTAGLICTGLGILLWIAMELITRKKNRQDGKAA